jgi:hypothetical protein
VRFPSGRAVRYIFCDRHFGFEKKFRVSQKDAAPIPNAVYGKQEVQFSEEIPTFKSQIPI